VFAGQTMRVDKWRRGIYGGELQKWRFYSCKTTIWSPKRGNADLYKRNIPAVSQVLHIRQAKISNSSEVPANATRWTQCRTALEAGGITRVCRRASRGSMTTSFHREVSRASDPIRTSWTTNWDVCSQIRARDTNQMPFQVLKHCHVYEWL
jgi:hypothetical protein